MGGSQTTTRLAAPATFLATAALLVAYAVDAGTYDLVARQEYGILVWWALFLGAAFGLLPARRPGVPVALALLALAGLAAWSAVSLNWSQSDERTLAEVARTLHHLGLFALVVVLAGRERWVAVVGGASTAAVVICAIALGIRLEPDVFGTDHTAQAFQVNRLSGPLGYWNAVGAWAAMTTLLLLAWSAHARTLPVRVLALAAVPLALVVLYLVYSRAAYLDLAFGLVVLVALAARRWTSALHAVAGLLLGGAMVLVVRGQPQIAERTGTAGATTVLLVLAGCALAGAAVAALTARAGLDGVRMPRRAARTTAIVTAVLAVLAIGAAGALYGEQAWNDFAHPPELTATDPAARLTNLGSGREEIWRSALATFADAPLKGSGAGTFEFTWNVDGRTDEYLRDGHSLLLEAFSELGLLGGLLVLLFLGAVVAIVVAARRRADGDERAIGAVAAVGAAGAAYVVAAGVDWMWELTAVTALFLVLAGAAGASTLRVAAPLRVPARVALAALALLAVLVMLPGLTMTNDLRRSERAVARGALPAAASAARDAERSAPWAASPHLQLALVAEQQGRLATARAELLAAAEREPTNWRIPFVLSRVEALRGDRIEALRAYRRARTLRPRGAFVLDPNAAVTPQN